MPRPDPPRIHPTAIVSAEARLADDVAVGPYTVVDGPVAVGPGCVIGPHCHLIGPLTLGRGNRLHAGCVLGDAPQHLGYAGEETRVEVGDGNTFREHATVHRGMPAGGDKPGTGVTTVGSHNFFMANSHVAHDGRVGSHCVFANGAVIGGHAEVHDRALLSGNSAVHQFCRVGRLALVGGTAAVSQDLPPFWIVQGGINVVRGVNVVGMRRAGVPAAEIQAVRRAFRLINRSGLTVTAAVDQVDVESGHLPAVRELVEFIRSSKRGVATGTAESTAD